MCKQQLYGALFGLVFAIAVMAVATSVAIVFRIYTFSANYFIGWISCMGYYKGVDIGKYIYNKRYF